MSTILQKIRSHYVPIYFLTIYYFFVNLYCKHDCFISNIKTESNKLLNSYSSLEINSKESKILLDLKYKNMVSVQSLGTRSFVCVTDFEGKLLGHTSTYDQKFFSTITSSTINLNKKLLHSTMFGSIKLIKL